MAPLIALALSLAPELLRHVAGDRAGDVAAGVATAARAVVGTDDAAEVEARIAADPLKRADFAVEIASIALERERAEHQARVEELRIAASDRADARAMARSGPLAWGAGLVTGCCLALLAAVLGVLALVEVPPGNRDVLLQLTGTIATMAGGAVAFWVGSSAGSAGKSGLLGGPFAQRRE